MIYLDASAAVKALVAEDASDSVRELFAGTATLISSRLLEMEVNAVAQRRGLDVEQAEVVLDSVTFVSVDDELVAAAVARRAGLRTLDALHLATAVDLADLITGFACFDGELNRAAAAAGLPLVFP